MRNEGILRGLAGAFALSCLAVACDTSDGSSRTASSPTGTLEGTSLLPTEHAAAVVARATSFREKGLAFTRDRARVVATPVERQVLPAGGPVDVKVVNGRLVTLGGALQRSFGKVASERFSVHDGPTGVGAHVTLRGASDAAAEHAGSYLVYANGHPLGDVLHRLTSDGVEDFFVLEHKPAVPSVSYDITLEASSGLRLVENTLEIVDAAGSPRVRVAPPYLVDSAGTRHVAELSVAGCAVDTSPAPPWGRRIVNPGASTCEVRVGWHSAKVEYPALLDPSWQSAGSMANARSSPAATVLNDGRVLVSGGYDTSVFSSAELFDPHVGTWATTGSMGTVRFSHSSNLVASGSVLAAGGTDGTTSRSSAELYNPSSGTWAATGSLAGPRDTHQAVTLSNGTVLVVGGYNGSTGGLATAELFSGSSWAASGAMSTVRQGHTATLLGNGSILVAGGYSDTATTSSSDVWTSGAFAAGPALTTPRYGHTGTLLGSGSVLLAGGKDAAVILPSETCAATCAASGSLTAGRAFHSASLMRDGRVLVAGGATGATALASSEVYSAGTFTTDQPLANAREGQGAVFLKEGRAFLAGGDNVTSSLASAEVWPQPTVTATPGANAVSVSWTTTPGNTTDYVAVAPVGAPPSVTTKFAYTGGAASGNVNLTGIGGGTYVARVFLQNNLWITAETSSFVVAGTGTTVSLNAASVLTSPSNIIIDYAGMSGSSVDWIAIAPAGSPNTTYTQYKYTGGALSGSATFPNIPNGTYVARAFFNNSYVKQAETASSFTVTGGASATVTLDGASVLTAPGTVIIDYSNMSGASTDWISIATAGSVDTSYVAWVYTRGATSGKATFNNVAAGSYVGRAYFNDSYTKQAQTSSFNVQ